MGADNLSLKRTVSGEVRLPDPVDDAILTLGVRMLNPLSYKEIASLFGITSEDVSAICQPYKEFLRTAGEDGPGLSTRDILAGRRCGRAPCGKTLRTATVGATLFGNSRWSMAPIGWPILLTMRS